MRAELGRIIRFYCQLHITKKNLDTLIKRYISIFYIKTVILIKIITIRRFQEHENTLYDLVKNICDFNDQNIYTRKVFVHFNRFYLRLANEYGMKSEVKIYYNKLKVVGENGIKQKIYYIMGMLGIKAR